MYGNGQQYVTMLAAESIWNLMQIDARQETMACACRTSQMLLRPCKTVVYETVVYETVIHETVIHERLMYHDAAVTQRLL